MKKEEKQKTSTVVITLRKLTWKSVIDFSSQYQGLTIQEMFDQHHTATLRWYYYNYEKISFIPEILRAIGIEECDEIPKPGKDPKKGEEKYKIKSYCSRKLYNKAFEEKDTQAILPLIWKKRKKQYKEAKEERKFSKASMAWKNQGHK